MPSKNRSLPGPPGLPPPPPWKRKVAKEGSPKLCLLGHIGVRYHLVLATYLGYRSMHRLLRLGKPGLLHQVLHQGILLLVPGSPWVIEEMLQAGETTGLVRLKVGQEE